MEAFIRPQICDAIWNAQDLSDSQYRLSQEHSTVGTIDEVAASVEAVNRILHAARPSLAEDFL